MKQLVKGSAALTAVSLSEMVMRFIRTKCIALILGPVGTGLLAQLGIFFELLRVWGDLGSRRGVIKQIAEQRQAGRDSARYGEVIQTSYFLAITASCITGLITTVFSQSISKVLFGTPLYSHYIIALAFLLPVASVSTVTASIVKGNLEYMAFAKYTFISYLAVMLVTPALIYFFHYWGALGAQALFFIFPLGSYLLFNSRRLFLHFSKKINTGILKEQFSYGMLQIYQDTLAQAIRVLLAAWIVKQLGLASMGIYQVVITFSTIYLSIPIQSLSGYSFPQISAAENSKDITRHINDSLRFLVFILVPAIILMMSWSHFFIHLFFSKDFLDAALPLQVQIFGTVFVLVTYPIAVAFQARGNLKAMIATATMTPGLYLLIAWFVFDFGKLTGIAAAYAATSIVMAVIHYYLAKRFYDFHFLPKNKKLLWMTALWVALALVGALMVKTWVFSVCVSLLGIPWFILSSQKNERDFLRLKMTELFVFYKQWVAKLLSRRTGG